MAYQECFSLMNSFCCLLRKDIEPEREVFSSPYTGSTREPPCAVGESMFSSRTLQQVRYNTGGRITDPAAALHHVTPGFTNLFVLYFKLEPVFLIGNMV